MKKILNEIYFHNNLNIQEMEFCFKKIIDKLKKNPDNLNPNEFKELNQLAKIIEKEFNFEKVFIAIDGSNFDFNAFTITFMNDPNIKIDKENCEIVFSKNGIKYKNSKNKKILLCLNVYNLLNLSERENMAVTLHEIGHNFFLRKVDYQLSSLIYISKEYLKCLDFYINKCVESNELDFEKTMKILKIIVNLTKISFNFKSKKDSEMNNDKIEDFSTLLEQVLVEIRSVYSAKYRVSKKFNNEDQTNKIIKVINKVLNIFKLTKKIIIKTPLLLLTLPIRLYNAEIFFKNDLRDTYDNEKFADNFAISYGYGKDLSSAFNNSNTSKYAEEFCKGRISRFLFEYNYLNSMIKYLKDPHPEIFFRIDYAQKKLEYELKNNKTISNEERDIIKKDIEKIKNIKNNSSIYTEFEKKWNDKFSLIDKKDKFASKYSDEEIFDFDSGVLKDFN